MKKIWIFCSSMLLFNCWSQAQDVSRVTFSSGGSTASNQLPASVGEVFVGGNGTMTMGSQQGSPGIILTSEPNVVEALLSPNPTADLLHIQLNKFPSNQGLFTIFSSSGQIMLNQSFSKMDFDISIPSITSGAYYLVFYNMQRIPLRTFTFIKQ